MRLLSFRAIRALVSVLGPNTSTAFDHALTGLTDPDARPICLDILTDYPAPHPQIEAAVIAELEADRRPNLAALKLSPSSTETVHALIRAV
jgi:hypothetical protein